MVTIFFSEEGKQKNEFTSSYVALDLLEINQVASTNTFLMFCYFSKYYGVQDDLGIQVTYQSMEKVL